MTQPSEARSVPPRLRTVTERPRRVALLTDDGVRIEARHQPRAAPRDGAHRAQGNAENAENGGNGGNGENAADDLVTVVAHGFSGALERPAVRRVAATFAQYGAVITFSFRGHGRSGGRSTVGDLEVLDLAAAVRWARALGHRRVATVGFSMGGSVVLRHAALYRPPDAADRLRYDENQPFQDGEPAWRAEADPPRTEAAARRTRGVREHDQRTGAHTDAVVSISAPARWYYRGTAPMRRLHWAVTRPAGRLVSRYGLRTRIHPRGWDPEPLPPYAAVPLIAPTPLLVVHGDRDPYFPLDHPRMLAAAGDPTCTGLWIEPGLGHAENAVQPALLHRIADWVAGAVDETGGLGAVDGGGGSGAASGAGGPGPVDGGGGSGGPGAAGSAGAGCGGAAGRAGADPSADG